jgi:hypothetical protein
MVGQRSPAEIGRMPVTKPEGAANTASSDHVADDGRLLREKRI